MMAEARDADVERSIAGAFRQVGLAVQELGRPFGWRPAPGSPAEQETNDSVSAWSEHEKRTFRAPTELVAILVSSRLVVAGDYLRSVAVLAESSGERVRLDFAAQVTGRAVLEAMAYAYWLVEPDIGHAERARRLVMDTIHDLRMKQATLSRLSTVDMDLEDEIRAVRHLSRLYGVSHDPEDDVRDTVTRLPKIEGPKRPRAIDIIEPLMPSQNHPELGAVVYHLLSNAAHASGQGILGSASIGTDAEGALRIDFTRHEMLRTVAPALWSVPMPVGAVLDYFGWDPTHFQDAFASAAIELSEALSGSDEPSR